MANNYEQIKALVETQGNSMDFSNAIVRSKGIPLDYYSVFGSYKDAVIFATENVAAYLGQFIAVIEGTQVSTYIITGSSVKETIEGTEYDNYLKQIVLANDTVSTYCIDGGNAEQAETEYLAEHNVVNNAISL